MQNSELKKEILGQHKEVSAKELERYLNGSLSDSEARSVEVRMNSSNFSSEAADGFKAYGNTSSITELNSSWKTTNYSKLIWITASAVAIVFISLYSFQSIEKTAQNNPVETKNNAEIALIENNESMSIILPEENSQLENIEKPKDEKPPEQTSPTPNNTSEAVPLLFSTDIEQEIFSIKPIETREGNLYLDEESKTLKTRSARLRHYKNYKLVDQGIGIDQSLLQPVLEGTPASIERIVVNPKYPEWMPADSIYKASINEAIDWIIEKDYKQAKMRFDRLISNTPEDLTATFYMGYTLYLKGEFEEAIHYLNKTQTHIIQTYDQDSRFIEVKCLLELGKSHEALKEALYLKKSNSFYADKAMELVE